MLRKIMKGEDRTEAQIRQHYEVEVELADKLRNSTPDQRKKEKLYTSVYDEMFSKVTDHPLLLRKVSKEKIAKSIAWQLQLLNRFIHKNSTFVEIGAGGCGLSFKLCEVVKKVYAVDVSNILSDSQSIPDNFELIISDGVRVELDTESVDVVYSNQLMEHIHPDDATVQLADIFRILKPGGAYICITPNKVNGPWDISYYYDEFATAFHLKEYTNEELVALFKSIGFKTSKLYVGARGFYMRFPICITIWLEKLLMRFSVNLRAKIGRSLLFRSLLGVKLVAIK